SSRRRHTSFSRDWSSDVCSSDLIALAGRVARGLPPIWGTAADDAAHFHTTSDSARIPGRAWIVARAPALTPDAIMRAVLQGEFRSEERRVGTAPRSTAFPTARSH